MPSLPDVSVVVPHYDDLDRLDVCLAAIGAQTVSRTFEIVVADNGSPQGLAAVQAVAGERARVVLVPEKGAGPARNGGVLASRGAILAFTDSDCVPQPGWLQSGVDALTACDVSGGRMLVGVRNPARLTPEEAFERVFAFDNETYVRRKGFTVTANLFCRREVFDRVGPFRTGVSEDVEWCLRARAAGCRLDYAEAAAVVHPARRSWTELTAKWARLNREAYLLSRERPDGRLWWLVSTIAMPVSALAHTPKVLASPRLERPADRLAALAVLYRLRFWRFGQYLALALSGTAGPELRPPSPR